MPHTDLYRRAEALSQIAAAPDYKIGASDLLESAGLTFVSPADPETIRSAANSLLRENKIISSHYQHVDGTSFAAPIVASVIAQMLEANSSLTPLAVKNILIATAERIRNAPAIRQGYGKLNAQAAVAAAGLENHDLDTARFFAPRIEQDRLTFCYHDDSAQRVALAGDFNEWKTPIALDKERDGIWRAKISVPKSGRYRYKFIVNDSRWIDDPGNGLKEPDNYGGFNSVVIVT